MTDAPVRRGWHQARPSQGGEGRGSPGGAGTHGQRSYLRVVGVGIVVSPGSVQREQHSRPPGPSTRPGLGSARLAGRSLVLSGLGRGLARDWTGQKGPPCP